MNNLDNKTTKVIANERTSLLKIIYDLKCEIIFIYILESSKRNVNLCKYIINNIFISLIERLID